MTSDPRDTVRPEIVDVLADVNMAGMPQEWTHMDGSPLTGAEREQAMSATPAELVAATERSLTEVMERRKAVSRIIGLIDAGAATENPLALTWMWWGRVIAQAVEDQDGESRQQLGEATGVPDAWKAFALIKGDRVAEEMWAETLELFASDLDHTDSARPVRGDDGYDPELAQVAEYSMRIIRGALAGNARCLPR